MFESLFYFWEFHAITTFRAVFPIIHDFVVCINDKFKKFKKVIDIFS